MEIRNCACHLRIRIETRAKIDPNDLGFEGRLVFGLTSALLSGVVMLSVVGLIVPASAVVLIPLLSVMGPLVRNWGSVDWVTAFLIGVPLVAFLIPLVLPRQAVAAWMSWRNL